MTLLEYIKTLDNDTYVKVGSEEGGGFIYCGKVEGLIEYLDNFNIEEPKRLKGVLDNKKMALINLPRTWANTRKRLLATYKNELKAGKLEPKLAKYPTIEDYKKHLAKVGANRREVLINTIAKNERLIAEYTDIKGREVLEVYTSVLDNEDGFKDTIIIFKGRETRYYWTLTEFRHGIKEDDGSEGLLYG